MIEAERRAEIKKMIKALKRMYFKGYKDKEGYKSLKDKLLAIKSGANYRTRKCSLAWAISSVGGFIPSFHACNTMKGKNEILYIKKLNEAKKLRDKTRGLTDIELLEYFKF